LLALLDKKKMRKHAGLSLSRGGQRKDTINKSVENSLFNLLYAYKIKISK